MNPLKSILGTIISGFVLAVIIVLALSVEGKVNAMEFEVWFHVLSGVTWIGLLYYFNFVQVPAVGQALAEANSGGPGAAAINKYVAPRALLWFRWGAVATWLTGVGALQTLAENGAMKAFMLQDGMRVIGIGAWLGTIMLFNVWVLIWPNQKKILGIVQASAGADRERQSGGPDGIAHQHPAVDPDADVHDRLRARPAVLTHKPLQFAIRPGPARGRVFHFQGRQTHALRTNNERSLHAGRFTDRIFPERRSLAGLPFLFFSGTESMSDPLMSTYTRLPVTFDTRRRRLVVGQCRQEIPGRAQRHRRVRTRPCPPRRHQGHLRTGRHVWSTPLTSTASPTSRNCGGAARARCPAWTRCSSATPAPKPMKRPSNSRACTDTARASPYPPSSSRKTASMAAPSPH